MRLRAVRPTLDVGGYHGRAVRVTTTVIPSPFGCAQGKLRCAEPRNLGTAVCECAPLCGRECLRVGGAPASDCLRFLDYARNDWRERPHLDLPPQSGEGTTLPRPRGRVREGAALSSPSRKWVVYASSPGLLPAQEWTVERWIPAPRFRGDKLRRNDGSNSPPAPYAACPLKAYNVECAATSYGGVAPEAGGKSLRR